MALRDILKDAIREARQPISDPDFIHLYNAALKDLARRFDTAKRIVETSFDDSVPFDWYPLTIGCIGVKRVLDEDNVTDCNWTTRDGTEIMFEYSGSYTVFEMLPHASITTMVATETIHPQYGTTISMFIAAKTVPIQESAAMLQTYLQEADLANKAIRRTASPFSRVGVSQ